MPKNKETLCFFVFLCFHKQTKQTLEVLSFIMKKQDNFVKEVVSFLKKLLVSRKHENKRKNSKFEIYFRFTSHNISYVIFIELKMEQIFK